MSKATTLDGKSLKKELESNARRRDKKRLTKHLERQLEKYESLVWYARSNPKDSMFWDTVPAEIKEGALNSQAKVEEQYPDEIDDLRSSHSDWSHGFNSGMLACLRLVTTASNPQLVTDTYGSEEETYWIDGLDEAIEEFPCLDT